MPARQRRDEVGGAEDVEAAAEDAARDAVERRSVPGYLRAVDGEVRGDGAVAALGGEDLLRVGRLEGLGCGGSGGERRGLVGGMSGFGGEDGGGDGSGEVGW